MQKPFKSAIFTGQRHDRPTVKEKGQLNAIKAQIKKNGIKLETLKKLVNNAR